MERVVIVIPTYNESENLPLIVPEVLAQDPRLEVLVVDDQSPDGTGKIADDLAARNPGRVHVLHREGKRGLGPAYRDGLRRALDLGADAVGQMDADFSHPPGVLPEMLREIDDCDVVLGSRYLKGITVVNWPIERILISYFGNVYSRTITGLPITDTTGRSITLIKLYQKLSDFDPLIISDLGRHHHTVHLRTHRHHVTDHIGIVGGLMRGVVLPHSPAIWHAKDHDDEHKAIEDHTLTLVPRRGLRRSRRPRHRWGARLFRRYICGVAGIISHNKVFRG